MSIANTLVKWYLKFHYRSLGHSLRHPAEAQRQLFSYLIAKLSMTGYGKNLEVRPETNLADFQRLVPIVQYDEIKPQIHEMMLGKVDVLWPGRVRWFSKSSGTTADKSKFIPVSNENLKQCHHKGGHDAMALWYHDKPGTKVLAGGKSLVMGGSLAKFDEHPDTMVGDVSAVMMHNMPGYAQYFHTPSMDIALMSEWEAKIELIADQAIKENVTQISGVPTWSLVLLRRILEKTGKRNIGEVFPNFELYMHGGVSFEPYRKQFADLLPPNTQFREVYNASEGFFAVQATASDDGMALLVDNGVFYEFIPMDSFLSGDMTAIPLDKVVVGKNYAMVISTNAGLWRYLIGDTVKFTSTLPYLVKVTGRTRQFINAFGEEVMVENTDKALAETCQLTGAEVADYTVAPVFMGEGQKGGHEWLVEFVREPSDLNQFAILLDEKLQGLNSDYEAKRYKNIALQSLRLQKLNPGTFLKWLKSKGKLGGQHKVPRLSNDRKIMEEVKKISILL